MRNEGCGLHKLFLLAFVAICLEVPGISMAMEPASAFEDAFTAPSFVAGVDAVYNYPGMESFVPSLYAAGGYTVPFGMDDLAVTTAFAGVQRGKVAGFASFSGSGFDLYGEEHAKLGLSYSPLKTLSAGLRLTRSAMNIKGFGDASSLSADAGVVVRPHRRVFIAAALEDIAGAELGESREPLDGRTRLAVSWLSPADVTLFLTASKVRRFDMSLTVGFIAEMTEVLSFGFAGASEPDRIEYFCGIRVKNARFAYRGWYHGELGETHGFSLGYLP